MSICDKQVTCLDCFPDFCLVHAGKDHVTTRRVERIVKSKLS